MVFVSSSLEHNQTSCRLEHHLSIFIDEYNRFRQPKSGIPFVVAHDLSAKVRERIFTAELVF